MSESRFGIVITAKMRHGDLWAAAKAAGGVSALARFLGRGSAGVYHWVNLKTAPSLADLETPEGLELERRLHLATGKTASELWPPELRAAIKGGAVGRKLEQWHAVEMRQLASAATDRLMLPSPVEALEAKEAGELMDGLLRTIQPRLRRVLELRFGLAGNEPHTLDEAAAVFGVCRERLRQLEHKALRKLRDRGCFLSPDVKEAMGVYVHD